MLTDSLLLLTLILINGVFALSEIAIVSSRRTRLVQLADGGNGGARHALTLASEPTRFLSSVQVGITSIGILNGAIGEASVASRLRVAFEQMPALAPYAETLSLGIMVVLLTYASLILGELNSRPEPDSCRETTGFGRTRGAGVVRSRDDDAHGVARAVHAHAFAPWPL